MTSPGRVSGDGRTMELKVRLINYLAAVWLVLYVDPPGRVGVELKLPFAKENER